jgi:hypothetical protein
MYEVACEPQMNCDTDQQSFKAYLSRWMAASTKLAPFVSDLVSTYLSTSAQAAAKSCSGGTDGVTCGTKWTTGSWDNTWGVGQQMNALEVIQGLLIDSVPGPVSDATGGTSKGNPSAGTGGDTSPGAPQGQITTGDRAGAGILTALVLIMLLGGAWYVALVPSLVVKVATAKVHSMPFQTEADITQVDGRVISTTQVLRLWGFQLALCIIPRVGASAHGVVHSRSEGQVPALMRLGKVQKTLATAHIWEDGGQRRFMLGR